MGLLLLNINYLEYNVSIKKEYELQVLTRQLQSPVTVRHLTSTKPIQTIGVAMHIDRQTDRQTDRQIEMIDSDG